MIDWTAIRTGWIARRNRVFASPRFQHWAARLPLIRRIARSRADGAFDLLAGFAYSQVLRAFVEGGLFDILEDGPIGAAEVAARMEMSEDGALTLLRAGRALMLSEEAGPDRWMLGEQGAVFAANAGVQAMVRHHRLLYADLEDPIALLRRDRREPTALSRFWTYAGALHGAGERGAQTSEYSKLMAASQHFVADEVLASVSFGKVTRLLDVGGGHGAFLKAVGSAWPHLQLGLFDLPEVVETGGAVLAGALGAERVTTHPGNFFKDSIPEGYDMVSLVRILHDHDDAPAQGLLDNIRASLAPGARLLIAEPMARISGTEPMGEAFFGLYLWAMGSGRPRSPAEIIAMLKKAGFSSARSIATAQPVNASVVIARA
ncbi:methyltransferase [Erythrobacter dokdonensis]|uniref:Hydroxyneurosporene methyltransferase CrtF n=1 Tax=Erythrobacter dokdonensis DSW-74 TaxID=1300349 RepID=A0A1A7BGV0_9SPHN|nr:methyltransferase [Erythrobacter dokdonensis]OBV10440.1 Hydroxyneurosporene methyltransferase CrtF [Erythrobacter dokdonensis DSW-74]